MRLAGAFGLLPEQQQASLEFNQAIADNGPKVADFLDQLAEDREKVWNDRIREDMRRGLALRCDMAFLRGTPKRKHLDHAGRMRQSRAKRRAKMLILRGLRARIGRK